MDLANEQWERVAPYIPKPKGQIGLGPRFAAACLKLVTRKKVGKKAP